MERRNCATDGNAADDDAPEDVVPPTATVDAGNEPMPNGGVWGVPAPAAAAPVSMAPMRTGDDDDFRRGAGCGAGGSRRASRSNDDCTSICTDGSVCRFDDDAAVGPAF